VTRNRLLRCADCGQRDWRAWRNGWRRPQRTIPYETTGVGSAILSQYLTDLTTLPDPTADKIRCVLVDDGTICGKVEVVDPDTGFPLLCDGDTLVMDADGIRVVRKGRP
jgi:hypothetical protein